MAGHGPAPKDPAERRNRAVPRRGEWQTIPLHAGRRAPGLPKRKHGEGAWSPPTKRAWVSWWDDGAATQWTPADETSVFQLAELFEQLERGRYVLAPEVRQRMDILGLTQKGKRDLRLRVEELAEAKVSTRSVDADELERRRRMRAIDPPAGE